MLNCTSNACPFPNNLKDWNDGHVPTAAVHTTFPNGALFMQAHLQVLLLDSYSTLDTTYSYQMHPPPPLTQTLLPPQSHVKTITTVALA